ncbi:MAG: transcriptional regulator [Pontixanthobacter sp.]
MTLLPLPSDPAPACFNRQAKDAFASHYPETPHVFAHELARDTLFTLNALAELAGRLSSGSVEYNRADMPIGVTGKPDATGVPIGETIRRIATSNSWAVLKNVEQVPAYRHLLHNLLAELRAAIESRTGAMLRPQAYIFISSPDAVTPYHFDPEHNILMQLVGSKVMTQFPAGDTRFAADTIHEGYHSGGPRELVWRDAFADGGTPFSLTAGQALYVPVMAPHFVRNGPESALSLSITWRSEWSFAEADARGFNRLMRRAGLEPKPPGRWPASNRAKAAAFRTLRRLRAVR